MKFLRSFFLPKWVRLALLVLAVVLASSHKSLSQGSNILDGVLKVAAFVAAVLAAASRSTGYKSNTATILAEEAQKVAQTLWRVENPRVIEDCPTIRFRHVSFGRLSFVLPVRPGHPDVEQFRRLQDGEVVEFGALTEGMDCALPHELCGYLRIKSVA